MSIKVKISELKPAGKVANQVRDVSAGGGKRYPWLNFYRLVANPTSGLILYATDGASWLTWNIQTEEPVGDSGDSYDVVLSSSQFNEVTSKLEDSLSYEITREDGQIVFSHGHRVLRMWEEAVMKYPQPPESNSSFESQSFSVEAAILAKNFKFVSPFIDAGNATAARAVTTWTQDGLLIAGSQRHQVRVEGMPASPIDVSFKQKTINAVVSFLSALEGDVNVYLAGNTYTFQCPTTARSFTVLGESVRFPASFQDLAQQLPHVIRFDGKTLLTGVSLINALLPAEADRLLVKITGEHSDALIHVATLATEAKKSHDAFPIIRETEGAEDLQFVVNCRIFESGLGQMGGAILEGRLYLEADPPRFCVEDERVTEFDTYRCVLIPVGMSLATMEAEETEEKTDTKKAGVQKADKKATLTKP